MKALTDRLFWVHFFLTTDAPDSISLKIAREESRDGLAIAEVLGVEKLVERLTYVRDYFAGAHQNRDKALETLCEAMAIAEALPEIRIVMPQPGFVAPDSI